MNWQDILGSVWAVVNSPAGITAMASAVLWALNKLYAKKPLYQQYAGTIIAAVRRAEKEIPDDSPNKSLARLDEALRYVLRVYEQVEGRRATHREVAELTEGIHVMHTELESEGILDAHGEAA